MLYYCTAPLYTRYSALLNKLLVPHIITTTTSRFARSSSHPSRSSDSPPTLHRRYLLNSFDPAGRNGLLISHLLHAARETPQHLQLAKLCSWFFAFLPATLPTKFSADPNGPPVLGALFPLYPCGGRVGCPYIGCAGGAGGGGDVPYGLAPGCPGGGDGAYPCPYWPDGPGG